MPQVSISPTQSTGGLFGVAGSITNTVTLGRIGTCQLYGWHIFNGSAATAYLQLFDNVNGTGIVLGTTTPTWSLGFPTGAAANILGRYGLQFQNGMYFAFTTTRTGSTAPGSSVDYNLFIK